MAITGENLTQTLKSPDKSCVCEMHLIFIKNNRQIFFHLFLSTFFVGVLFVIIPEANPKFSKEKKQMTEKIESLFSVFSGTQNDSMSSETCS